ncbi:MAG: hypothetical protein AB1403_23890, partial [Candidatus Riflebacteria bacterium]
PALANSQPSAWTFALEGFPPFSIYAAYLVMRESALLEYLSTWRHVRPRTDGETLKALGLPPGPGYRQILTRLRAAWLDGEVRYEDEEKKLLESLLKNQEE